jgi:lipoprotein signal peptidase
MKALASFIAVLLLALIAGVVVVLDQYTKHLVRTRLALGGLWMPLAWLAPYVRVVHWTNTGAPSAYSRME